MCQGVITDSQGWPIYDCQGMALGWHWEWISRRRSPEMPGFHGGFIAVLSSCCCLRFAAQGPVSVRQLGKSIRYFSLIFFLEGSGMIPAVEFHNTFQTKICQLSFPFQVLCLPIPLAPLAGGCLGLSASGLVFTMRFSTIFDELRRMEQHPAAVPSVQDSEPPMATRKKRPVLNWKASH